MMNPSYPAGSGEGGGGQPGPAGKSAYQQWLDEGNAGSAADFLSSLEGPSGPKGDDGEDATAAPLLYQDTIVDVSDYATHDALEAAIKALQGRTAYGYKVLVQFPQGQTAFDGTLDLRGVQMPELYLAGYGSEGMAMPQTGASFAVALNAAASVELDSGYQTTLVYDITVSNVQTYGAQPVVGDVVRYDFMLYSMPPEAIELRALMAMQSPGVVVSVGADTLTYRIIIGNSATEVMASALGTWTADQLGFMFGRAFLGRSVLTSAEFLSEAYSNKPVISLEGARIGGFLNLAISVSPPENTDAADWLGLRSAKVGPKLPEIQAGPQAPGFDLMLVGGNGRASDCGVSFDGSDLDLGIVLIGSFGGFRSNSGGRARITNLSGHTQRETLFLMSGGGSVRIAQGAAMSGANGTVYLGDASELLAPQWMPVSGSSEPYFREVSAYGSSKAVIKRRLDNVTRSNPAEGVPSADGSVVYIT